MDEKTIKQQGRWIAVASLFACLALSGCATMMKGAIPVSELPTELTAPPHCPRVPIDFTLLRQPPPPSYLVGPRDILGVYIRDVLGRADEPPPVFTLVGLGPSTNDSPLAVGNPVTVADDGTIILPQIPPLRVAGMTIPQIDAAIRRAYTMDFKILAPGQEVVTVTLIRKRLHRVVVIREDAAATPPILKPRDGTIIARRGTTTAVDLPSFENDVLHALTQSGGLPGEDARNEIWVLRAATSGGAPIVEQLQNGIDPATLTQGAGAIVRIPLSVAPGAALPFGPADIVLHDGDVLYVQGRQGDCFYTGGLLPGGQFLVPRDFDLDIVNAISLAGGAPHGPAGFPLIAQVRSGSGPGNIVSPTRVLVIRKTASGGQIKIYIDLRKALNDPRERVLVQSGDTIYLFWQPWEVIANVGLNVINFNYDIP